MKKLITLFSSALFLAITSCSSMFNSLSDTEVIHKQNADVLKIYTGDDGPVYFSDKYPGIIIEDELIGVMQVPFELFSADSIVYRIRGAKEKPLYVYSNGSKFGVFRDDKRNLVYTSTLIRVPVSNISYIQLKEEHKSKVILTGFVVGISALSMFVITNMSIRVGDKF